MHTFSLFFILFILYSFIGWLWEVIDKLVEEKKFINRGFLIGPYCPIYGVGCILLVLLLTKYTDNFLNLFIHSIIICSILEYFTSYFMEKIFHARWWDYSKQKFNLNGRICAETMIPFGIFGSLIVGYVHPFLYNSLDKINNNITMYTAIILLLIFVLDLTISTGVIFNFRNTIKGLEKDATEQITKKVREILTSQGLIYRRLINAFPDFTETKERLIKLRERIEKEISNIDIGIKKKK